MPRRAVATAVALILLALPVTAQADGPGDVEYRAAPGRVVIMPDERDREIDIEDTVALPDNSALVAWSLDTRRGPRVDVMRLRADGGIDRDYGVRGVVRFRAGSVAGLQAAPDGGATAVLTGLGGPRASRLVRLDARGRREAAFGQDGTVAVRGLSARKVAPAPGGALVVSGTRGEERGHAAVRITAAGAIDRGFGAAGFAPIVKPIALAVADDGGVLAISTAPDCDEPVDDFLCDKALLRYDAAGQRDAAFAGEGFVRLPSDADGGEISQDAQGRYWVIAELGERCQLMRLAPDGRPDVAFSADASAASLRAYRCWIRHRPTGPLVVTRGRDDIGLVRIGDDGAPSELLRPHGGFGGGQILKVQDAGELDRDIGGRDVAIRPDGVILVASSAGIIEPHGTPRSVAGRWSSWPAVAALRPESGLEPSFGRASGQPRVELERARRAGDAIALRVRAETRGLARVIIRRGDDVIARRMIGFFRPGRHTARATLDRDVRGTLPASARVTVEIVANDLAGNSRELREQVTLRCARACSPAPSSGRP